MSTDRRQDIRVVANGSVIVHGRRRVRGRLSDISSSGLRMQLTASEPGCTCGDDVELEVHLDRAGATWLRFLGRVLRVDQREIAILFTAVPLELAGVIRDVLVSTLEGSSVAHVLLVDANLERRVPFAALLRRAGCRVMDVATPLEAIAHLGGSAIESWVVAIADTTPASIAEELRRFLAETDARPGEVVALGKDSQNSSLTWYTTTGRPPR
jgi:hypothetical protein